MMRKNSQTVYLHTNILDYVGFLVHVWVLLFRWEGVIWKWDKIEFFVGFLEEFEDGIISLSAGISSFTLSGDFLQITDFYFKTWVTIQSQNSS